MHSGIVPQQHFAPEASFSAFKTGNEEINASKAWCPFPDPRAQLPKADAH
jgi:hypothetical protein